MVKAMSPLLSSSDKSFWHGYVDFYEPHLPSQVDGTIVEFGVFKGNSIRWLTERYPQAHIVGVDILPVQPDWPQSAHVHYVQLDQGSEKEVASFFANTPSPALIIEDGSHIPEHQSRCLRHGLKALQAGGVYILEDIHTSHPDHVFFKREFGAKGLAGKLGLSKSEHAQTSLSVLLAIEHIQRSGRYAPSDAELEKIACGKHFSSEDIQALFSQIASVHVYKRTTLPTACFNCGSTLFDYNDLKCVCGTDLLGSADSMSVVIHKKRGG